MDDTYDRVPDHIIPSGQEMTGDRSSDRSEWPVKLYKDGFEVHLSSSDRFRRRAAFVPVTKVTKIRILRSEGYRPGEGRLQMSIDTTDMGTYRLGDRFERDVIKAVEYIRQEWPSIPEDGDALPRQSVRAPVIPTPPKAEVRPLVPPVPSPPVVRPPTPIPQAPTVQPTGFCARCGAHVLPTARFCPACGRPTVTGANAPTAYTPMPYPDRKNPRTAMLLAFLPGLIGIMGLGYFYTRRLLKGVLFLFVGPFLALLALGSLLMVLDPQYGGAEPVNILMAIYLHLWFFLALLGSTFDAGKAARGGSGGRR